MGGVRHDIQISKFLSLVLRHKPSKAGVELDAAGWAPVPDLIEGARAKGVSLDEETLLRIVRTNDKQRYTLSPDGTRIRANQGHSVKIDLGLEPAAPPAVLFHGTSEAALESIRTAGLKPMRRRHVHLSADRETARGVGARHGRPVVLEVDAAAMVGEGFAFFRSENGVWLTDHVPAACLAFPDGQDSVS